MKCKLCGVQDVVFRIEKVVGNVRIELLLCEECANKHGVNSNHDTIELSLSKLINSVDIREHTQKEKPDKICHICGTTYEDYKRSLKFGCYECYNVFSRELKAYLKRNFGRYKHRGKVPEALPAEDVFLFDLGELRSELQDAVKNEEYEKAAELRDRIRALEQPTEGK